MNGVAQSGVLVWQVGATLPIVLLVAWLFGSCARWVLRGRARLGVATSMVISILGTAVGLMFTGLINPDALLWSPLSILLALGMSIVGIGAYGTVAAHFQRSERVTVSDLLHAGESDRVEFKSTARVNLRTGAKDERMEQVIAKTICAFLNADGGTLLMGVDDTGTPLGLDPDFATLKSPDADRFELWLRDLLTTGLGQNAATIVSVDFASVPVDGVDRLVCRATCVPSPRAVYLRPSRGAGAEFWVRSGNSTRQLSVDETADYVMHRWPLNLGSTVAAQLKAAVRFSGER